MPRPTPAPEDQPLSLVARPRVRDQGEVGCCVSIAVTGALELLLRPAGGEAPELSPMFHYWVARRRRSTLRPLTLLEALRVATTAGICAQRLHDQPITPAGAGVEPSAAAIADARALADARYDPVSGAERGRFDFHRIPEHPARSAAWRANLAAGWPVLVGFWFTPGYHAITKARPIHGPVIRPRESVGHAVLCVGYDPRRGFRLVDAKGPGFADHGAWWLPPELAESPLVQESWSLHPRVDT